MKNDTPSGYAPFDEDVHKQDAYLYTQGNIYSAVIANERYTKMITSITDFTQKSVVDIGSGDGTYTVELLKSTNPKNVEGVEPSPKAAERAQKLYGSMSSRLSFSCGESKALVAKRARFDLAVYRGVIHHVEDPVGEIARALCIANTVIILEPNGWNPLMKVVEKTSAYHRQHGERSYTPSQLTHWVEKAGGRVTQLRFFGLVPYFSPKPIARIGRLLEPLVEQLPLVRSLLCGQYIMVAQRPQ